MLLAGDVGGTKTHLAVFSSENGGPHAPLAQARFSSDEYSSLEDIIQEFLAQVEMDIERAAFGVAGPVIDGRARITNLPWTIDAAQLQQALGLSSVSVINDLEAIARAVPFLEPDDLHVLNEGQRKPGGTLAVIAPGTGLGQAYLIWDGSRYRAFSSEGGHTSFAPGNALQIELLRFLQRRFGHVSWERVCSGAGIPNLYAFLKHSGRAQEPDWLAERLTAADDPAPVISNLALGEETCEICRATMALFVSLLGAEAGNLALKVLSTGGVYLGGGIPPQILPALTHEHFMEPFLHKGRMTDLLAEMPVHVILNPDAALFGAACRGLYPD